MVVGIHPSWIFRIRHGTVPSCFFRFLFCRLCLFAVRIRNHSVVLALQWEADRSNIDTATCLHPLARTIQSIPALTPSHIQRQRRHRGSHRNTHPDTPTYLRSSTPASSIPAVQARSREHMLKGREGPGILMRAARMNFTVLTAF